MHHIGLLVIRLGLGIIFLIHGTPKLTGGPVKWAQLGSAMKIFGLDFLPQFWGFMAAFSETFGAVCIMVGILWKPACGLLSATMLVATFVHISAHDPFRVFSHPLSLLVVFIGLIMVGPGKYRPYHGS